MKPTRIVICDEECVTLYGPSDASVARMKLVEGILKRSLRDLAREFNRSRIPQMKGFKLRIER